MRTAAQGERSGVGPYIGCQTAVKRCRAYADSGAGRWRRRAERAARGLRSGVRMSDFKLSPKNQAGVFVGFATLKGIYGSVLMVGEGKYVVAREHVNYVQDHFPLQKEKSANPELDWLHRLLGRQNDIELAAAEQVEGGTSRGPQGSTEWEEEVAFDPSLLAPGEADCAEDDSDGLASDDGVKAVLEQLDESIPHLSQNTPAVGDTVVSQASQNDG